MAISSKELVEEIETIARSLNSEELKFFRLFLEYRKSAKQSRYKMVKIEKKNRQHNVC